MVFVSTTLAFVLHHDTPSGDITTECRGIVEQFLEQWICKPSVIGSPMFGGRVLYSQNTLSKLEPEVKV